MSETGSNRASTLPTIAKERKEYPVATGVLDYFPDAIVAVAHVSYVGNEQHNPGQPLHWAREKSTDQDDTLLRHFLERGKLDSDGQRHTAKLVWRALALLQLEIEAEQLENRYFGEPGSVIKYDPKYKIGLRGIPVCGHLAPIAVDDTGAYCSLEPGHDGIHRAYMYDDIDHTSGYAGWPNSKPQAMAPRPGGAF